MKENIKKAVNPVLPFPKERVQTWATSIEKYVLHQSEERPENLTVCKEFYDTIREILTEAAYKIAPIDDWELSSNGFSTICSKKLRHDFIFDTWLDIDFYMQTSILYSQHLSRMPDKFWGFILELEKKGNFIFEENAVPKCPKELQSLVKKKDKSQVFKIIQSFILFTAQGHDGFSDVESIYEGFGSFQVSWPVTIGKEELIDEIFDVFKLFYKISYMLYRHEYILTHHERR